MSATDATPEIQDEHPTRSDIRDDVLAGLMAQPKKLSSMYFYDARGSHLFEQICEQPEYYLTRAELELMRVHVEEIAAALGPDVLLIEYGSGSGIKTRMLLEHLESPVAYVPVEISRSALATSVAALGAELPDIEMLPVCANFTEPFDLPRPARTQRRNVIYFPGSTIGNFTAHDAAALLEQMRGEMGVGGAALLGVDLVKDPDIIEAAYNDAAGITEQFTLNMLVRFNHELGADFDLDKFFHRARYNPMAERIETSIVSKCKQQVRIADKTIHFDAGEAIHVEYSCKYSAESFAKLAARADLRVAQLWKDPAGLFSVQCLVAER